MKALKLAGAAIAAVIVVIALLLVIGIPSGFLTAQIEERVERETGYKLAINGGAKIGLWPSLNITLNDVTLQNPKDSDINRHFAAASIEADVTLASLWAGRPHITELVIVRPVVNLPLRRERVREANPPSKPARGKATDAFSIEHVSVTGGTIVFSNLRDRVERRIETVNADITIDSDRKIEAVRQRPQGRPSAEIRAQGDAARSPDRAAEHPGRDQDRRARPVARPAHGQGRSPAQRLRRDDQQRHRRARRCRVQRLGLGRSVEQAAGEARPRFPEACGRDDAQHRQFAGQPWSSATIDVNGLNYIDLQARISAAELKIGDARFTPAAIDATLASGVLKAQVSNLGAYEGSANGDLTVDVSTANPTYAMRADLTGVRALPLLDGLADFDRLDGKMQAKLSVRSSGASQRAIMSNMAGTAFVVFQDGAIKGLNVAQMIRSLTASTLSGWQESEGKATDLSQLSASFKIDKGQAQTTDLNLVGPLVKMTGAGTIDLGTKQIGFRVEPKLVMTTEGQGRASDPVGLGIPVMIAGPWGSPRIYPEMQGILDNPEAAYAKLKEMGKGLFGEKGAGLGAAIGSLLGGQPGTAGGQQGGAGGQAGAQPGSPLGGQLGETIGNLLQQGLEWPRPESRPGRRPTERPAQHPEPGLACPGAEPRPRSGCASRAPPAPPSDTTAEQDSQPMNEVLRQLFNR